jgi:hypothetical protein
MRNAYSSELTGRWDLDVHTRSTATGLPLISALNRGERSSGRRQSSGFGALTAPGCGITSGQNW